MKTLDSVTSKVLSDLDRVIGRRVITIKTRTMPDLKKDHPFASTTGRATCKDHGLVKFSRWDIQVGDEGLYGFLVNCLWTVIGKADANGQPRVFVPQGAFYERRKRMDGTSHPWAVAKPKGSDEEVLYLPGQVVKTHAHFYEHNGVLVDNSLVDGVWTRPDAPPKTQEVSAEERFIRWRAPKIVNIAAVENIGDEITEGGCVEKFREAVDRYAAVKGLTAKEVAALFAVTPKVAV